MAAINLHLHCVSLKGGLVTENVIHIPCFEGNHKTGLIFSMIEGLIPGSSLKFVCETDPEELVILLRDAEISNLSCKIEKDQAGHWEFTVKKMNHCCGLCGGTSSQGKGG